MTFAAPGGIAGFVAISVVISYKRFTTIGA